jgi:hypothetical protein
MLKLPLTALTFGLLVSCAASALQESSPIVQAVALQDVVLADPRFAGILSELEEKHAIDWRDRFFTPEIQREAGRFRTNTAWLLGQYAQRRGFSLENVRTWRKWNPLSSTVAITDPLGNSTKLNLWKLSSVPSSIAATLIHERVHSFGAIHPETQTRLGNECDASYVAGDLAQVILVQGGARASEKFDAPMCRALCKAVQDHGLASTRDLGTACSA